MAHAGSARGTCTARAALAGNPSDGFGGAVLAVPIRSLVATVTVSEADEWSIAVDDPAMARLLRAAVAGWTERQQLDSFPPLAIDATTEIPRSVGLGGSSALVISTLRALAEWSGTRWEPVTLARIALDIENVRLRITAGLQDRLVQAVGEPVAMSFDPIDYEVVHPPVELPLFVAWTGDAAESSDMVHRSLRDRFDGGETAVVDAMRDLAGLARRARAALASGDLEALGDTMDRSFDVRASILDVGDRQRALIATGRDAGAWVNSAGSGGSVVGLVRGSADLPRLQRSYTATGAEFLGLC